MTEHSEIPQPVEHPAFSTNSFDIKFMSNAVDGFEIQSKELLLRHAPNTPLPFANRIKVERARDPKQRRVGSGFSTKVGVRNIVQDGNTLRADFMPVTFATYKAISSPDISQTEKDISNPSGTALILLTTEDDGSSKLIVQHRSPNNFFYGDIPGASVAGMFDGTLNTSLADKEGRGKLKEVKSDSVKGNSTTEMKQEIGLYPADITDLRITGFASDKVRIHDEFLLMARTKLSSQDILFRSGLGDHDRFVEQAITIDASKDAITRLLTEVRTPMPPTHQAALIAAGYNLILEQEGINAAEQWKNQMQVDVNKNNEAINDLVKIYYDTHPDELNNIPQGKPPRNQIAYEPAYLPSQQGLPDMESELERLGLVNSELGTVLDEVCIFDVDGVLTVPDERKFDRELMELIAGKLKNGEPIILNTGRPISWLQENIIARLYFAHNLTNKSALQNLFLIGEKGGTWMNFDENGYMDPVPHKDSSVSVPKDLQQKVKDLISSEFSDTMFYDETKQSMITAEKKLRSPDETDEESMKKFEEAQSRYVEKLRELLKKEHLDVSFKIDPTTIATDVENIHLGDDFGAQRAIAWLKQRKIAAKTIKTFGDSKSDFAMPYRLHEMGMNVEHIHVGKESDVPQDTPYPVVATNSKYNNGTKEYLTSH